jgi:hypothetical protein
MGVAMEGYGVRLIRFDYYVGMNGNLKCESKYEGKAEARGKGKGKAMVYFFSRKVWEEVLCSNAVQKYLWFNSSRSILGMRSVLAR